MNNYCIVYKGSAFCAIAEDENEVMGMWFDGVGFGRARTVERAWRWAESFCGRAVLCILVPVKYLTIVRYLTE